jgi:hypothetical protein
VPDEATCSANLRLPGIYATLTAAVKRGTLGYDPQLARQCLDALEASCLANQPNSAACINTFKGRVPAGGVCVISAECVDNGGCAVDPACTAACCSGTCIAGQPSAPIGGACSPLNSRACLPGAYCQGDGTCGKQLPVGSPCDSFDACEPPGFCDLSTSVNGMCRAPAAEGAACDPAVDFPCSRTDYICDGTALVCTKRKTPGQGCAVDDDCVPYASCANGACQALPAAGHACDPAAVRSCLLDAPCVSNACAAPPPADPACVPPGA